MPARETTVHEALALADTIAAFNVARRWNPEAARLALMRDIARSTPCHDHVRVPWTVRRDNCARAMG